MLGGGDLLEIPLLPKLGDTLDVSIKAVLLSNLLVNEMRRALLLFLEQLLEDGRMRHFVGCVLSLVCVGWLFGRQRGSVNASGSRVKIKNKEMKCEK